MQSDIDKVDIEILCTLYSREKLSPLYSWQVKNFLENLKTSISYNTTVRRLQKLCEKDFISKGYKERNADTYYLNENGINFVENDIIKKENVNINSNIENEED